MSKAAAIRIKCTKIIHKLVIDWTLDKEHSVGTGEIVSWVTQVAGTIHARNRELTVGEMMNQQLAK